MTVNPCCLISRHVRLVAFTVMLWICYSNVIGARASRISLSTPLLDTRPASSSQDLQILELKSDDTVLLSARDISPDTLATATPVSLFSYETSAQLHPENKGLRLRSSSRNVSGIAGFILPSLPIVISELTDLLSNTRTDLQNYVTNSKTPFYQFNTTKWSFSVITANLPIRYTYIQAVVLRFVKLLPKSSSPSDITSTRVGVILNGSVLVADIIIMPLPDASNHNHVPFSSFGEHDRITSTQPIEISTVTPSGSSCSYQIVNETAALLPFSTPRNAGSRLQPRSIETEILARVGRTAFAMSFRFLRDPNGLPIEVRVSAAVAMVSIGLWRISRHWMEGDFDFLDAPDSNVDTRMAKSESRLAKLDTEFFEISRLNARLVMQMIRRDDQRDPMALALNTWKALLMLLADPLVEMNSMSRAWAMEGNIYGPANGDQDDGRNSSQVRLGQWELFFGSSG